MSNNPESYKRRVGNTMYITLEQENKIKEMYLNGDRFSKISEQIGIKQRFIRNCIGQLCIEDMNRGENKDEILKKWKMSDELYKNINSRYKNILKKTQVSQIPELVPKPSNIETKNTKINSDLSKPNNNLSNDNKNYKKSNNFIKNDTNIDNKNDNKTIIEQITSYVNSTTNLTVNDLAITIIDIVQQLNDKNININLQIKDDIIRFV